MEYHDRLAGITVKGEVQIIHAHITVLQCKKQIVQISGYLDTWDNVSFDDKRRVVDLMITTIAATSDSLNITWKI